MLNKNERKGKVDQVKGRIKQAVGTLTGDEPLKAQGRVDEAVGKVEEVVGRVTRKAGDAMVEARRTVKR